jgi:FdhD protein
MSLLNALPLVPPPALSVTRQLWGNGSPLIGERILAEEAPVAFSYDGATHAVLMATPADLEEFAVGSATPRGLSLCPPR